MSDPNPEGISMDMHGNLVYPRLPQGVFAVGDTYDAQCECGWEATGFEESESAEEVLRIHKGDAHCYDCDAVIGEGGVCHYCFEAEREALGRMTMEADSD